MKKHSLLTAAVFIVGGIHCIAEDQGAHFAELTQAANQANQTAEPVADGPYKPDWDSLKQYQFPEWFRDAKFGIWAHWGPQCEPEQGDWYARNMYFQYNRQGKPNPDYVYHVAHYGHPSTFGFKDVIPLWTAANWDPDKLMQLYKRAGARYFMALANHHDNFDTWDSKYQPWNAVNIGPKKDLIAGWAKAARDAGLYFGVSVHAARAWSWNNGALGADQDGPKAGVQYDGRLTAADGKGLWWDGLDPQDLYAQNHGPKDKPSAAYMQKYFNRTMDLINRYHPDLLYFDDDISGGLPLLNDDPSIGLRIAAHFYNTNLKEHDGKEEGVIAAKKLTLDRRKVLLYDIERGASDVTLPQPWETDTCIGHWHYDKGTGERNGYKKSPEIIRMLADIVSKNGNLMLSIPVRADGTIDDNEIRFLTEMGAWMDVNGESIYSTRPWTVFGEGPASESTAVTTTTGEVVEKKDRPLGPEDIRFTVSKDGGTLYAIVLGWPSTKDVTIRTLATGSAAYSGKIASVKLLGSDVAPAFSQDAAGLHITLPSVKPGAYADSAIAFKITL
jgi:alpha-L-fucosidase